MKNHYLLKFLICTIFLFGLSAPSFGQSSNVTEEEERIYQEYIESDEYKLSKIPQNENVIPPLATVNARAVITNFSHTGGFQEYIVPAGVTSLRITTWGAQGASAQWGRIGGLGARMQGDFSVTPGEKLIIAVGGIGHSDGCNGGGGGGTFVVRQVSSGGIPFYGGPYNGTRFIPLNIAGGGGGTRTSVSQNGNPGVVSERGTTGSGWRTSGGGSPTFTSVQYGGRVSSYSWGSGGGGLLGYGGSDCSGSGGGSFTSGALGGSRDYDSRGGFGGGGNGSGCCGGGGGGGYSGGEGGRVAGGGGSYNIGTNQSNSSGVRSGNGFVRIETLTSCELPLAICKNYTTQLDASGNVTISVSDINNFSTAECGLSSITLSETNFNCSNIGANTVTLTVTDINGASSSCNATVTIVDNTIPQVITSNITRQLNSSGGAIITVDDIDNGSNDACGIASRVIDISSFGCSNIGDNTVTLTVTDNNGKVASETAIVTIEESDAPTEAPTNPFPFNNSQDICYDGGGAVSTIGWTFVPDATEYDVYFGAGAIPTTVTASVAVTSFNVGNLSGSTTYFWKVVPKNACGSSFNNVDTWSFTTADAPCSSDYCEVSFDEVSPITKVSFATIDNSSSASTSSPSYENFTPISTTVSEGSTQTLTVQANSGTVGTPEETTLFVTAFFDWNQNGDFTDDGPPFELLPAIVGSNGSDGIIASGDIIIPTGSGVSIGSTTMRVMASRFIYNTNPCAPIEDPNSNDPSAGQTEDYTVNICALPEAICKDISIELGSDGTASITPEDINNGSTAGCGQQSLTISKSTFDCSDLGVVIVDLVITDDFGITSSCQAAVTVNNNLVDFGNVQFQLPNEEAICLSESITAFGQVFEFNITEGTNGQAPEIIAQWAVNTNSTNPSSWDESLWQDAVFNGERGNNNNNDEYKFDFTPPSIGNYYYTFRYSVDNGCSFLYGLTGDDVWNGPGNIGTFRVDPKPIWFADLDGDGFGNVNDSQEACDQPSGYLVNADDCDDTNSAINPAAPELYFDDIDNDCNPDTIDFNSGIFESYVVVNDQFYDLLAPNTSQNTAFEGVFLGSFTCNSGLNIDGGENKVFKCTFGAGDILNGKTFYRIYKQGDTPPAFSEIGLDFSENFGDAGQDCINQKWQKLESNINLLGSLTESGDYVLEVYNSADYTWDVPNVASGSGTHSVNNGGINFKATFTYTDNPPVAVTKNYVVELDNTGNGNLSIVDINNGSSDDCGAPQLEIEPGDQITFTCADVGTVFTVTLIATDSSGQTDSSNATVTVVDNIDPVAICPTDITVSNDFGECGAIVTFSPSISDNCPGSSLTASPASGTFFAVGTTQVTVTGVDASNNEVQCTFNVTVNDTEAPGGGTQFPAPDQALINVPEEASNYSLVYELNIPNNSNWDTNGEYPYETNEVAYTVNNSAALANIPFTRVAYMMELDGKWVWVSFDQITQDYNEIGIPADYVKQQAVSNMNVFASANAGVTTGTEIATGNVEFWSNCYSQGAGNGSIPQGNNGRYDFNDSTAGTDCYGSFQVHNYGAGETLFAFNSWSYGQPNEAGIGNQVGGSGHPDWTFSYNAASYTTKKIYVLVLNNSVVCNDVTLTLDAAGNATLDLADVNAGVIDDNCGVDTTVLSKTSFDCTNLGENTVTLTITDIHGNVSTCTSTVTVIDTTDPTWTTAPADEIVECDGNGNSAALTAWLAAPNGTDVCGTAAMTTDFNATTSWTGECGGTGYYSVTFTLTDQSGNDIESTKTFTIKDDTNPTWSTAPADLTVECDGAGNTAELNTWLASFQGGDICGTATQTNSFTALSDECGATGSATVTFTLTDECGNNITADATFTIEDTTNPDITAASDLTVECDGTGNIAARDAWLANNGGATSSDDCSSITWSNDYNFVAACGSTGAAVVTFTSTDDCGHSSSTTATFTIKDDTDPTWTTAPADLTVECDGAGNTAELNTWLASFQGGDICGTATQTNSFTALSDECGATGSATVTFTLTDECGNNITADATFTIEDTTNPDITAASDLTVECDGAGNIAARDAWLANNGGATSSDDCSSITWSNDYNFVAACGSTGAAVVTFTSTDDCGHSSSTTATFTIKDDTDPTWTTAPADLTVECDGLGNTQDLNDWLNTDFYGGDVCNNGAATLTNNFTALSDDCGATGSATVTFTLTDDCGNDIEKTVTFTIEDTTNPDIFIPSDVTINCEDNTTSAFTGVAAGSDICSGVVITESDVSTQVMDNLDPGYYNYTITRTWTVVDECSNTSTFDQIITVQDVTPPVVDCKTIEVILNANGDGSITAEQLNNSSYDNCSAELFFSISEADEDFECADIGGDLDDLIISEYVDGANFENYIELYNGTGLTVDLSEYKLLVYYDGSATPTKYQLGGTVADRQPIVISHPGAQGFPFANNTPLITFNGDDAIALEHNGTIIDLLPVYNSTISLVGTTLIRKDTVNNGNVSSATGADGWTQVNGAPIVDLLIHDIIFKDNDHNVLLTVTDISGNISTCIASVTVIDNINPTAIAQDVTVQLDANGEGSTTADAVDDGSFDNCDIASLVLSKTAFTCEDIATNPNQVTLTVTDVNGNVSTTTADVTVEDNVNPNAIAQDITVQLDASGNVSITADDVDNDTTPSNDACGIDTMTVSPNAFDCDDVGPNTVTLTVTDNNGNVSTANATVTVEDNVDPVALCKPVTVTLDSSGNASITAADIDNGSNDACGIASLSLDITSFGCDDVGNPVTVKLTVTDNNNNVSTCTALVTVEGDIPTVSINDPEELPEFCQGAVLVLTTTATYAETYLWSTGETTESIEVGPDGGTFTVTVTSGTNCVASDTFTVAPFDESELLSSYTILAENEVFLHGSNLVQTGGVGVSAANGLIKLHQASNIVGFGRAVNFTLNQGSTIGNQIPLTANIPYPAFVPNNLSNAGSPDATINNNQSVTLNGSVYDEIVVKQGATVTFSQPNVYINDLKTFDGASIEFTQCTNVYINEKFMLAQNGKINKLSGQNVVIYVNEDVQIEKGSYVRARLHSNGNELLAKGGNANGNKAPEPTEMIGLFICKKVHGSTNVVWNADPLCDPCTPAPPSAANTDTEKGHSKFEINSWPNPSDTEFNVKIVSENTKDMISISVFDMSNKLVHSDTFSPDDVHKFGDKLEAGVYIVKVTQGPNIKTVRLVRY